MHIYRSNYSLIMLHSAPALQQPCMSGCRKYMNIRVYIVLFMLLQSVSVQNVHFHYRRV